MEKNPQLDNMLESGKYKGLAEVIDCPDHFIMSRIIPMLSSKVYVDDIGMEILRSSASQGPVIYALKYRNLYDIHFLRWFLRKHNLPEPCFAFSIPSRFHGSLRKMIEVYGSGLKTRAQQEDTELDSSEALRELLSAGGAATLFLVDEKTTKQRYVHPETDPIQKALDVQGRIPGSITIVPMFVMYDRRPKRTVRPFWEIFFGESDRPGPVYRVVNSFRKWILPELLVGKPMNLLDHLEEFGGDIEWEDAAGVFRKRLTESINDRIRVSRGPERLSKTELKEKVLRDPKVQLAVGQTVKDERISPSKARSKAEAYVDEIAADQKMFMLRAWYTIIYYLLDKLYDKVDCRESDFEMIKQEWEKGSLIYVPCHKSHIDYLVNLYFLFIKQVMPPLTAAGKNLSFWPVGPMMRYAAAFFIRRSFKGLNLYKRVFESYLKELVQEKYSIQFFIEGGRSRTGKLLEPKLGFLSFLLQTVERGEVDDLMFLPLYIGYDQVLEEKSFLNELSGKEKEKENLWGVIKARKFLRKRHGAIYLRFHKPISFRRFCNHWGDIEPENLSPRQSRKVLEDFAQHIMTGIVRSKVFTALELTAACLTCRGKSHVRHDQVKEAFGYFSDTLMETEAEFADELNDPDWAIEGAVRKFVDNGLLKIINDDEAYEARVYEMDAQDMASLQFYKNALVNHLWGPSFLACILLGKRGIDHIKKSEIREDFKKIEQIMYKEITRDPLILTEDTFEKAWRRFIDRGWIDEGGRITHQGRTPLTCLCGITFDLLSAYYMVLETAGSFESGALSLRDFTRKMNRLSEEGAERNTMVTGGMITNSVTVVNALLRFRELGALRYKPAKKNYEGVMDPDIFMDFKEFLRPQANYQINGPDETP